MKFTVESSLKSCVFLSAAATFALTILWAKDGHYYLGEINTLKGCRLAWHAALMICGFFLAQILAILSWGWPLNFITPSLLSKRIQKTLHITWQATAAVLSIFALVTIYKYKNGEKETHLSTFHSWIGMSALVAFTVTVLVGVLSDSNKALIRCRWYSSNETLTRQSQQTESLYKILILTVIVFSALAIVTGISSVQSGTCSEVTHTTPSGCKIANTLGLMVIVTVALAVIIASGHFTVSASTTPTTSTCPLTAPLLPAGREDATNQCHQISAEAILPSAPPALEKGLPVATRVTLIDG